MRGRAGSGPEHEGERAGQPEGSPFGPLELPRDRTEMLPAYGDGTGGAGAGGWGQTGHPAHPSGQPAAPPPAGGELFRPRPDEPGAGLPDNLFRPGPSSGAGQPPADDAATQMVPRYPDTPPPAPPGGPQYSSPAVPPRSPSSHGGGTSLRRPGNALMAAAVVGAVVVLAVGVLFAVGAFSNGKPAAGPPPVVTPADTPAAAGGGSTPSTTPSTAAPSTSAPASTSPAKAQAQALNALLETSSGSRQSVGGAVQQIQSCRSLPAAVAALKSAAAQRDNQVRKLRDLKVDQLKGGSDLTAKLRAAWEASAKADREYAAWGQEMDKGKCHGHARSTSHRHAADKASGSASRAKNAAVRLWNPLARQNGLPVRTSTEI